MTPRSASLREREADISSSQQHGALLDEMTFFLVRRFVEPSVDDLSKYRIADLTDLTSFGAIVVRPFLEQR